MIGDNKTPCLKCVSVDIKTDAWVTWFNRFVERYVMKMLVKNIKTSFGGFI